jgi:transcriptional regulator with XRE-family HTH domain
MLNFFSTCYEGIVHVYNQIFFTNVIRMMEEQGMSKLELALRADMSPSFLSDLTNGRANPSLKIMESIARALDVPLPMLLEATDLPPDCLDALAGGKAPRSLPEGFVRVCAILKEYQAFNVRQWDDANRKLLAKNKKKA